MPPKGITLRPQVDSDLEFVAQLYAESREEELRPVEWPDEVKHAFLRSQFDAQWAHYSQHYHDAEFSIVERHGSRIGRLYIWRGPNDVRIVDIAICAEARGAGIGSALLREVMEEAARTGKSASIHVERDNRALGLYRRLGFERIDEHGVYYLMRWLPSRAASGQPKTAS
jgi:ribosomal protein S18 acetylase RimI-like enzyme